MEIDTQSPISKVRHSLAHVLAHAVQDLYPNATFATGPVTEIGFYYDVDFSGGAVPGIDDLPKIEARMREIVKKGFTPSQEMISVEEARTRYKDTPYKSEIIEDKGADGDEISIYTIGDFVDPCSGPHVDSSKDIDPDAFMLDRIAGAYWKGDENNPMLTRIYGLAFNTKEELEKHLAMMEEAKKRGHRKLGKELDLFTFSDMVGAGLPLWTPKGTTLRTELQNALFEISKKYGVEQVTIPHIAKRSLYETSGHAAKFGDELIKVVSHYDEFVMKPVNCPHHIQIYKSKPRSYRDLPLRYMESTMQYRDEKPGEIGGLTRVRSITVDDGHTFCRVDQIKEEAMRIAHIIEEFYSGLGLYGKHWVSLSVRDPNNPDAYVGEPDDWDTAEHMLKEISDELALNAKRVEGEAAIYGPKLDYMFKDSLDREWQLATIQIDFALPKRFELTYTDTTGKDAVPVMLHRAILGSYERFLAILIEHFAGAFPLWLAPEQVRVLTVSEKHSEYAREVYEKLKTAGIRAELDDSDESLGKKIRNAKQAKLPYFLVLGDKEVDSGNVTCESRSGESVQLSVDELISRLQEEIRDKRIS